MDVKVYYKSGNIQTFKTTYLPFPDGFIVESDVLHLNVEELMANGLILDRLAYELIRVDEGDTEPIRANILQTKNLLIEPKSIVDVLRIVVDGEVVFEDI